LAFFSFFFFFVFTQYYCVNVSFSSYLQYGDDIQRKMLAVSPPRDPLLATAISPNSWNERFQTLLETPIKTPEEAIRRSRLISELSAEFVEVHLQVASDK
jgi:hypothetical protein